MELRLAHVDCPVCQQPVDIRRGYPGGDLCEACSGVLVLKAAPATLPPQRQRRCRCCCCSCPLSVVCGLILLLAMGTLGELFRRLTVETVAYQVGSYLDGADVDWSKMRAMLPPSAPVIACQYYRLGREVSIGMDFPLMELALKVAQRICQPPTPNRARGGGDVVQERSQTRGNRGHLPHERAPHERAPKEEL